MKRRMLVLAVGFWVSLGLISCGGGSTAPKKTGSGLPERVIASQGVSAASTFGALVLINGYNDTLPRVSPLPAGNSPRLMAVSPTLNLLMAFDPSTNTVYAVNAAGESGLGNVHLPGPTSSMVIPTANPIGYAAVPTASVSGYSFVGAVEAMNLSAGAITTTIAVANAQTVVTNPTGSELLVFSNDSNSVTVIFPGNAVPPVDTSCITNPPNSVCAIVTGFDRPVNAIIDPTGTTAYIFNCGAECGGIQASVAVFDMGSLTITNTINVNGATFGFLSGSQLYVAGNGTPTGQPCASIKSAGTTAATYCGTLDVIDLNTMSDPYLNSPSTELAIPDGFHDRMSMSLNGHLFVGSYDCTNIGDVNNPVGEVRGCLAIFNTNTNSLVIPPDNGDVDGLQSFTSRYVEYVAEGGNLRVYDTTKDILLLNDYVPEGTIDVIGYVGDVKSIDFF